MVLLHPSGDANMGKKMKMRRVVSVIAALGLSFTVAAPVQAQEWLMNEMMKGGLRTARDGCIGSILIGFVAWTFEHERCAANRETATMMLGVLPLGEKRFEELTPSERAILYRIASQSEANRDALVAAYGNWFPRSDD